MKHLVSTTAIAAFYFITSWSASYFQSNQPKNNQHQDKQAEADQNMPCAVDLCTIDFLKSWVALR